jgi:hypothetical protein
MFTRFFDMHKALKTFNTQMYQAPLKPVREGPGGGEVALRVLLCSWQVLAASHLLIW